MKAAVIFSVPMSTSQRFAWRWRSEDYRQDSTESFRLYHLCVADAERNGYEVRLSRIGADSSRVNGVSVGHA